MAAGLCCRLSEQHEPHQGAWSPASNTASTLPNFSKSKGFMIAHNLLTMSMVLHIFTCFPMNGQIYPKCPKPWAPWWASLRQPSGKAVSQTLGVSEGRRQGRGNGVPHQQGWSPAVQVRTVAGAPHSAKQRATIFLPFRNIDPDH